MFLLHLEETFDIAGFEVAFVRFVGGDWVTVTNDPQAPVMEDDGCGEVLISNITRDVDFYDSDCQDKNQVPLQLPGCSEWVEQVYDNVAFRVGDDVRDKLDNTASCWWCYDMNGPLLVRFLPGGPCPEFLRDISSAAIRQAITTGFLSRKGSVMSRVERVKHQIWKYLLGPELVFAAIWRDSISQWDVIRADLEADERTSADRALLAIAVRRSRSVSLREQAMAQLRASRGGQR